MAYDLPPLPYTYNATSSPHHGRNRGLLFCATERTPIRLADTRQENDTLTMAEQKSAGRLVAAVVAVLMIMAECARAGRMSCGSRQVYLIQRLAHPSYPRNRPRPWAVLSRVLRLRVPPPATTSRSLQATPSSGESSSRNDQLRIGESYIGIQTNKNLQVIDPLKRSDCSNDDECCGLFRSAEVRAGEAKSEKSEKAIHRAVHLHAAAMVKISAQGDAGA